VVQLGTGPVVKSTSPTAVLAFSVDSVLARAGLVLRIRAGLERSYGSVKQGGGCTHLLVPLLAAGLFVTIGQLAAAQASGRRTKKG